jgi:hypothetical protein
METITNRGVLIENGSDISFHDVKMEIKEGSALEAKDSQNLTWYKVTVTTPVPDLPFLKLAGCNGVIVTNCYQPEAIPVLVSEDEKSKNIIIANNILPETVSLFSNKGKNITTSNNIIKR